MGLKEYGLTAREGILLHLFENKTYRDDLVCPEVVTQLGISRALKTDRSYISYVLNQMMNKGLVEDRLCHIEGGKRKRKAYFLSPEGSTTAEDIRKVILDTVTSCIHNGSEVKGPFQELVQKTGLSLTSLVIMTDPEQVRDLEYLRNRDMYARQGYGSLPHPPVPDIFVGRKKEMDAVCGWFKGRSHILVITGIAGTGKTSLIGKAMEECGGMKLPPLYIKASSWGGEVGVISDIAKGLEFSGRPAISLLFKEKGTIALQQFSQSLEVELENGPLIIVLDDVQELLDDRGRSDLLELLLELDIGGLRCILLSREMVHIDPRKYHDSKGPVHLELTGLTRKDVNEYLKRTGAIDAVGEIFSITSGHPLYLTLLVQGQKQDPPSEAGRNFRDFLRREVIDDLNRTERDMMDLMAMIRVPPSRDDLFNMDAGSLLISEAGLQGLIGCGLLTGSERELSTHQLISEVVSELLPRRKRKELHSILAEHYRERLETDPDPTRNLSDRVVNIREHLYHTWGSGSLLEKAVTLSDLGEELMSRSLTKDLGFYSDRFIEELDRSRESEGIDPVLCSTIFIFNGWSLSVSGSWEEAEARYGKACEIALRTGNSDLIGRCENAMGTIYLRKGELEKAGELISSSISKMENRRDLCKARSNLAVVLWMKGELKEALEEVDRSLDLALYLNDAMGVARGLINKGIILAQKRDLQGSRSSYEKAMVICEKEGFIHNLSIVHDNLGEIFREMGDKESSMEHFRESLRLASSLGFKWQIAEAKRNIATLTDPGAERTGLFLDAIELFKTLGDLNEAAKTEEMMKNRSAPSYRS